MAMKRAPVLFVSHGSPMFAVEPGLLGPMLEKLGDELQDCRAILIVSAHWQTPDGVRVMATAAPETIHDFRGFPDQLYALQYPAQGAPDIAAEASQLLGTAGFKVQVESRRGLDHGAWVPLRYLAPQGRLPVLQVSMPNDLDASGAARLGAALAPLRDRGVLIVGSGSLTHNLYEVFRGTADIEYAQQFVDWIRRAILERDTNALVDYRHQAPSASRAHPTEEHFLPLLVALGASDATDSVSLLEGGMTYGVLSMDSFLWSPAEVGAEALDRKLPGDKPKNLLNARPNAASDA